MCHVVGNGCTCAGQAEPERACRLGPGKAHRKHVAVGVCGSIDHWPIPKGCRILQRELAKTWLGVAESVRGSVTTARPKRLCPRGARRRVIHPMQVYLTVKVSWKVTLNIREHGGCMVSPPAVFRGLPNDE